MSKRVNSSNISMKTKSRKGSEVKRSKDSKDFKGSEGSKVSEGSTDVEEVRKDVTVVSPLVGWLPKVIILPAFRSS